MTKMMTGGEAIVAGLLDHGIDKVFGLPGVQVYGLFDAFHRAQPKMRIIGARHEQACGYMAFGAARATGRPSVCSVVPGPGVLNAGAALITALACNTPVLCLTGQVPRAFLDRGRGNLHEMRDQLGTLRGLTKHAARIEAGANAKIEVARAFQEMTSGRPGPAALEMPWDVFTEAAPVAECKPFAPLPPPPPNPDSIAAAARLITESKAPMIFVGSGAIDAGEAVLELAERLDAPVIAFRGGRGIVSNAHELGLTIAAAYELWPETDLIIGIGTRLELPLWRWSYRPNGQKMIRIDIDPAEMRRTTPDVAIVADADQATRACIDAIGKTGAKRAMRRDKMKAATARSAGAIQSIQPQMAYLNILRDVLPEDGIVTDEVSQVGFTSWYGFPVYRPRTFISSGYQGTLGFGFPTALGVKAALPDRPVVAIAGDGGFMFAVQELATAVQFNLNVVTLVFNNQSFGNVRRDQMQLFDGRVTGADLVNPDFVKLAGSFGVEGARITSPEAFRPVLERALAADRPQLIEIVVPRDSETNPWPFIRPAPPRM
jgi:acetolactate synthase I/II/III large subunit